jgi:predicted dinucleotide-utilizing enzyme
MPKLKRAELAEEKRFGDDILSSETARLRLEQRQQTTTATELREQEKTVESVVEAGKKEADRSLIKSLSGKAGLMLGVGLGALATEQMLAWAFANNLPNDVVFLIFVGGIIATGASAVLGGLAGIRAGELIRGEKGRSTN